MIFLDKKGNHAHSRRMSPSTAMRPKTIAGASPAGSAAPVLSRPLPQGRGNVVLSACPPRAEDREAQRIFLLAGATRNPLKHYDCDKRIQGNPNIGARLFAVRLRSRGVRLRKTGVNPNVSAPPGRGRRVRRPAGDRPRPWPRARATATVRPAERTGRGYGSWPRSHSSDWDSSAAPGR